MRRLWQRVSMQPVSRWHGWMVPWENTASLMFALFVFFPQPGTIRSVWLLLDLQKRPCSGKTRWDFNPIKQYSSDLHIDINVLNKKKKKNFQGLIVDAVGINRPRRNKVSVEVQRQPLRNRGKLISIQQPEALCSVQNNRACIVGDNRQLISQKAAFIGFFPALVKQQSPSMGVDLFYLCISSLKDCTS